MTVFSFLFEGPIGVKRLSIILLGLGTILLSSCSYSHSYQAYSYSEEFQRNYSVEDGSLPPIRIVSEKNFFTKKGKDAHCVKILGTRMIILKKKAWNRFSDGLKWAVIYHEMGHCEFDLNHVWDEFSVQHFKDGKVTVSCPSSIMSVLQGASECYDSKEEKKYYIRELKNRIENSK